MLPVASVAVRSTVFHNRPLSISNTCVFVEYLPWVRGGPSWHGGAGNVRGDVAVGFGCEPSNAARLVDVVLDEVDCLQAEGPSKDEVSIMSRAHFAGFCTLLHLLSHLAFAFQTGLISTSSSTTSSTTTSAADSTAPPFLRCPSFRRSSCFLHTAAPPYSSPGLRMTRAHIRLTIITTSSTPSSTTRFTTSSSTSSATSYTTSAKANVTISFTITSTKALLQAVLQNLL